MHALYQTCHQTAFQSTPHFTRLLSNKISMLVIINCYYFFFQVVYILVMILLNCQHLHLKIYCCYCCLLIEFMSLKILMSCYCFSMMAMMVLNVLLVDCYCLLTLVLRIIIWIFYLNLEISLFILVMTTFSSSFILQPYCE